MGLVGCTVWMASCQETLPQQQAMGGASYETMKIVTSDKAFTSSYSASIRGRYDANILPQVSGTIQKVMVEKGKLCNFFFIPFGKHTKCNRCSTA